MRRSPVPRGLRAPLMIVLSITALHAANAVAAPTPTLAVAPRGAAPLSPTSDTVLKRLPAGREELTFRGESAARSFTVQLGRSEAARATSFQVALLNAVSLLPERSVVKISVNGIVLAALQAGSPDKASVMPVRIPPGLLVPGANTVRISAALTHRVDCSVQATYELWASLDPSLTGFLVPREAAAPVHALDDLALEPLAADGTTRIHLRMAGDPEAAEVTQAAAALDALVRRAGLVRPVVDVGPDPGTGPGFDVAFGTGEELDKAAEGLTVVGRGAGVVIGREATGGRLVVVLARGTDPGALATPGAGALPSAGPTPIQQGFRRSFAELGLTTETFAGRHSLSTLDVALPPDFLASNDRARLLLDGGHAATLIENDGLVFRVNGTLVSSLPFAAGRAERFSHAIVELPLRFFHPGHNEVSIEGTTSAGADAQCDTAAMSRDARLTIAGSSELDFPTFARLATLPQIPAAMAFDAAAAEGATHLYVPATDRASLGAGLTALANMAASQARMDAPQVHIGMPAEGDTPGIVVAESSVLPENLAAALGAIAPGLADAPTPAPEGARADSTDAPAAVETSGGGGWSGVYADAVHSGGGSLVQAGLGLLRDRGFFFTADGRSVTLPVATGGLVIAAVAPQLDRPAMGGVALPQLTRDPAHWLVVTAASRGTVQVALAQLIGAGRWAALGGEAVSFDPAAGALHVLQPRTVGYVLPQRLVLSDLRPILGGVMSDNIILSVGAMLVLMSLLGVSTHLVIRRMGVR